MPHRGLPPPGLLRDVTVTLGVVLFVLGLPRLFPRWWRDPSSVPDMPAVWTRRRSIDRVRRGRRRQAVVVGAAFSFGSIAIAAETFSGRLPPLRAVEGVGMALALTCVALAFSVRLFNRPRMVVPPSLRDEPGAIKEILEGRGRGAGGGPPRYGGS